MRERNQAESYLQHEPEKRMDNRKFVCVDEEVGIYEFRVSNLFNAAFFDVSL